MMHPNNTCTHPRREYTALLTNGAGERYEWYCDACQAQGVHTQHEVSPVTRAEILHAAGIIVTDPVFHSPAYLHRQLATR